MRSAVFLLAALNPAFLLPALPLRGRVTAAAVAAVVTFPVLLGLAAISGAVLDGLDVSASTFRIAAGIIALGGGAVRFLDPVPQPAPEGAGWQAGLVPLAFPLVLAPDVALLAVSLGADHGVVPVAAGAAAAIALWVAGAAAVRDAGGPVVAGVSRLLAAMLVVAGVALAVDGIQDL